MKDIYDYKKNINVITTANGDKVITMNEAIFTSIRNAIYSGSEHLKEQGYDATAKDIVEIWKVLVEENTVSEVK